MAEQNLFDFEEAQAPTEWLVKDIIPKENLVFVLAQAGVGKSFWVEQLGVSVAFEKPFMGVDVEGGDVLIVDQDTNTPVLRQRLAKFGAYYKTKPKYNLYWQSMENLSLKNTSLIDCVNSYPTVKLVIIDSLTSVSMGLNMCEEKDMGHLNKFKKCLRPNLTIIITHHISEKKTWSVDKLMTCDPHGLSMYSSVINQQADTYFVVGSNDIGKRLTKLYIRPVTKRTVIDHEAFTCDLVELNGHLHFDDLQPYDISKSDILSDIEEDILTWLKEEAEEKGIKDICRGLGDLHSEQALREATNMLRQKKLVSFRRHKHNQYGFTYKEREAKND